MCLCIHERVKEKEREREMRAYISTYTACTYKRRTRASWIFRITAVSVTCPWCSDHMQLRASLEAAELVEHGAATSREEAPCRALGGEPVLQGSPKP